MPTAFFDRITLEGGGVEQGPHTAAHGHALYHMDACTRSTTWTLARALTSRRCTYAIVHVPGGAHGSAGLWHFRPQCELCAS
eukprot:79615-Chlamydomonas_euryale.AAC.1